MAISEFGKHTSDASELGQVPTWSVVLDGDSMTLSKGKRGLRSQSLFPILMTGGFGNDKGQPRKRNGPGSSKSWTCNVTSGDYQFFKGLSEETQSFQSLFFELKLLGIDSHSWKWVCTPKPMDCNDSVLD